ncbi:hypothetical protein Tco_0624261 [Tanacetum coccineum]|uniref:Uncharacterized protein n=1 Tax=Tanacetum coccineum TaxID=301880 RepID=A0ABQ4WDH1_9ASTR
MLNPETNTPSLVSIIKRAPIYDISTPNSKPPRAGTAMLNGERNDDFGVDGVCGGKETCGCIGVCSGLMNLGDRIVGCCGDDLVVSGEEEGWSGELHYLLDKVVSVGTAPGPNSSDHNVNTYNNWLRDIALSLLAPQTVRDCKDLQWKK